MDKQLIIRLVAEGLHKKNKDTDWLANQCGVKTPTMEDFLRPAGRAPSQRVLKLMAIALGMPGLDPDHRQAERAAVG